MTGLLLFSRPPVDYGLCQGVFNRPSLVYSVPDSHTAYSQLLAPLGNVKAFPFKREDVITASIVGLYFTGSPATVIRLIIAVVVDAIYGISSAGPVAHIFEKVLKRIKPTIANPYAPLAIIFIGLVFGVITPTYHSSPRFMFRRTAHAVIAKASTTKRTSRDKAMRGDDLLFSTVTTAYPFRVSFLDIGVSDNSPSSKSLAGKVFLNCCWNGYNLLSHVRTSFTNVMRGLSSATNTCQSPLFYHRHLENASLGVSYVNVV